jgi:signal transduction histidine kinase
VDWKRHLILIFKEAMNNILRHSDSKNVNLEISVNNNEVLVFLSDDGNGFDTGKSFEGNGLKNMKHRAEKIDGYLEIDSQPKMGTKISFRGIIPYISLDYDRKVA